MAEAGFAVRLIGRVDRAARSLLRLPEVDHRGEVPHAKLPAALSGVDAFVLPYRLNSLTRAISPAKTYEGLATGRPVVASPLPSLAALGDLVYLAESPEEFVRTLRSLPALETEDRIRKRISAARQNSWEARFAEIEEELWRRM